MPIQTKFTCNRDSNDSLSVYSNHGGKDVIVSVEINDNYQDIYFDIPTAIKFAKTLRTEINKIKEVKNV